MRLTIPIHGNKPLKVGLRRSLLKAAGIEKGSQTTGRGFVGKVTMAQCREIAKQKMADLNAHDLEAAAEMIKGSARSMGLQVVEG